MKVGFPLIKKCALLGFMVLICGKQSWSEDAMNKNISNNMTLEQINNTVSAALPRGTTLADIDKYFTDNRIEHGYYRDPNQVLAMVHNIRGGFFPISKDAQIIITLDNDANVATIEVKSVLTGP